MRSQHPTSASVHTDTELVTAFCGRAYPVVLVQVIAVRVVLCQGADPVDIPGQKLHA